VHLVRGVVSLHVLSKLIITGLVTDLFHLAGHWEIQLPPAGN